MSIFKQVEVATATGKTKELYDGIQQAFGGVPNLFQMLGDNPAMLEAVLGLNAAITVEGLTTKDVEQIALTVSSVNACDYCVATHVAVGSQLKIEETELMDNIQGVSKDPKMAAILKFTKEATLNRGQVTKETIKEVTDFGVNKQTIIEILGVVGLYTFLNYLNHLTQPEIDFPVVEYSPITK